MLRFQIELTCIESYNSLKVWGQADVEIGVLDKKAFLPIISVMNWFHQRKDRGLETTKEVFDKNGNLCGRLVTENGRVTLEICPGGGTQREQHGGQMELKRTDGLARLVFEAYSHDAPILRNKGLAVAMALKIQTAIDNGRTIEYGTTGLVIKGAADFGAFGDIDEVIPLR